ncbi:MAG TPA: hypothetical protein VEA37_02700 [Flavobacterium sp.]|nr:hypothetical protein [Flavobacterium sp.]
MAEIMTLETYPEFIMKSPNAIEFFETMKKEAAERGNLNHAAGLERVIKWIKEKHHGKL